VNDTQTNENFMKFVEEMGKSDKTLGPVCVQVSLYMVTLHRLE